MSLYEPGTKLSRYTILGKLAAGGMSEIYLARLDGHMGFSRPLVLKVIQPHLVDNPKLVKMFRYEAQLTAMLNHPNLVQIHGFEEVDDLQIIAMEFMDGRNLRQILKTLLDDGRNLPRGVALHVVHAIAGVLEYAHQLTDRDGKPLRIVHRDISLENIMLTHSGQIKLLDFGIAKAAFIDIATSQGKIKGKVQYMAPEMILGQKPDQRIDVYALGVVLYSTLLMRKPYGTGSQAELLRKIISTDPPRPSDVDPSFPPQLEQIVMRALHRDPEQRYQSAGELRRDLEAYIDRTGAVVLQSHLAHFMEQVYPPESDAAREQVRQMSRLAYAELDLDLEELSGISSTEVSPEPPLSPPRPPSPLPAVLLDGTREVVTGTLNFLRPLHRQVLLFLLLAVLGLAGGALAAHRLFPMPPGLEGPDVAASVSLAGAVQRSASRQPGPAPRPAPGQPALPPARPAPAPAPRVEPATPQPERVGRLSVRVSRPAVVYLDGRRLGRAPIRRLRLTPGSYRLQVKGRGRRFSINRVLTVEAGRHQRLRLAPRRGVLRILVKPWARVRLDGRSLGTTPVRALRVLEGDHVVVATNRKLGARQVRRVRLAPGQHRTVRIFLRKGH